MTRSIRWAAFGLLLLLATLEAGCYIYAPEPAGPPGPHPNAVWVPGHYNRAGPWTPGHWR